MIGTMYGFGTDEMERMQQAANFASAGPKGMPPINSLGSGSPPPLAMEPVSAAGAGMMPPPATGPGYGGPVPGHFTPPMPGTYRGAQEVGMPGPGTYRGAQEVGMPPPPGIGGPHGPGGYRGAQQYGLPPEPTGNPGGKPAVRQSEPPQSPFAFTREDGTAMGNAARAALQRRQQQPPAAGGGSGAGTANAAATQRQAAGVEAGMMGMQPKPVGQVAASPTVWGGGGAQAPFGPDPRKRK